MINYRSNPFLYLLFVAYLGFSFSHTVLAAIDPIEEIISDDYPLALRWENIEGGPVRLSGEEISYNIDNHLHIVQLRQHQQISIHLNKSEMLRILALDEPALTDGLIIEASNGTSLYSAIEPLKDNTNENLIISADNAGNRVIKISNLIDQEVKIALFISRHDYIKRLSPYRNLLDLPLETIDLVDHDKHQTTKYWLLDKSRPFSLELNGTMRIALQLRFKYQQNFHYGRKPFYLTYSFDEETPKEIHLSGRQDYSNHYTINNQSVSVARNETVYIDVPDDKHQLHIKSSDAVLLRILALDEPDYLLPDLNENPTSVKQAKEFYHKHRVKNNDIYSFLMNKQLGAELYNMQWVATFIAINNELRDSALDAISLLETSANNNKGLKQANHFAETFRRQHTFYRKLLPYENISGQDIASQQFILYPLRHWNQPTESYYMISPFFSNACESLNQGYFFSLPNTKNSALSYHLPERIHDSRLRVIVDQKTVAENAIFYLQYDDNKPIKYTVSATKELPLSYFNPSTPEACVSRSIYKSDIHYPLQLGHDLTDVAYLDVQLPANVHKIKIWNKTSAEEPSLLKVALQYETSKPYDIPAQFYISLIEQRKEQLFDSLFLPYINNEEMSSHKLSEQQVYRLTQGWNGLKAFLLSRKKLFSADYVNTNKKHSRYYSDDRLVDTVYKKILSNREQKNWLDIIELFASLHLNPEHKLYVKLYNQFYHALEQTGENNLRETMLRGAFLFDDNNELRQSAFNLLKSYYEEFDFDGKLSQLLITRAYLDRDEISYKMLVLHLIEQGNNTFALQMGLLLKQDDFLTEKLLQASYSEKKWYFFDYLLAQIHEPTKQLTWNALKSLSLGDMTSLRSYLSQLQGKTSYLLEYIDAVLAVQGSLSPSNSDTFIKQWQLWSQWKLNRDNDKLWRRNNNIISRAEGAVSLYNLERNLFETYFRASKDNPVKLSIVGPARIRIGVRLLYKEFSDVSKKTMLVVNDNNKKLISPLLSSIPAQGLSINELPDSVVGSIQYFEYAVGKGAHYIEYYAKDYPVLSTVSTQQPAISGEILPDVLTPDMLNFIVSNSKKTINDSNTPSVRECQQTGCLVLYDHHKDFLDRVDTVIRQPLKKEVSVSNVSFADDIQDDFYLINDFDVNILQTQFAQLCLFDKSKNKPAVIIEPLESLSKEIKVLKQKCIAQTHREKKAIELLAKMYWYFQQHPESRDIIEALAGSILEGYFHNPYIKRYSVLFERQYKWVLQSNVSESAGIRFDTIRGWHPVSSYARIRKALHDDQLDPSLVLTDNRVSGITLANHVDSKLKIDIKNLAMPFHHGQSLSLRYQLDDQGWRYIELESPRFEKQLTVFIPSGTHSLKIQWLKPILGQYVSINFSSIKNKQNKKLYNEFDRYYHIATEEEPVKAYLGGPARLRIDYQTVDGYSSEFVYIPEGLHKLTLPVINNNQTVLYRIFKHVHDDNIAPAHSPVKKRVIARIPFSQWYKDIVADIEEHEPQQTVHLVDKYTLGRQEDGTFALGMLWTQGEDREDNINNSANNDYFEYNFNHYYFVEEWQSYFDSVLLYRDHDAGKPSYGFKETIFVKPEWLSFAFRFNLAYYTQKYESPKGKKRAWSSNFRLGIEQLFTISPKWSHLPKLTVFHKNYEHSGFIDNAKTDIDYDVWNEYGEIHDRGLIVSDTLYYYPWLDTQLSSGFSYYSDEDYRLDKPEHLSLRFGWLQILDRFIIDLDYRWTYYFAENGHDWNRSSSSNKGVINTNLYWDSWLSPTNRLLANLKLSYDTKINDMTATIGFNYYFDQGRGFRDFRPHTQSFRDLRERHRFWGDNNLLFNETK